MQFPGKGHEEIFWGDRNALYCDRVVYPTGISIGQNHTGTVCAFPSM